MKFLLTLLLLTLFLDASYIRSIRVTSFLDKDRAEQGLLKLKEFVKNNKNLNDIEEKLHFQYTIHKIDKHYLIVLEPITDKIALQEILDTLRVKYKEAYPRRLETVPKVSQEVEKEVIKLPLKIDTQIEQVEPKVIAPEKVQSIPTVIAEEIKEVQEEKISPILHDNISQITDNSDINTSKEDTSTLFISILAILLIVSFFYIYFSRRKAKHTHHRTLTEIVLDNKEELKLKDQKINIVFEDDEIATESILENEEAQSLMSNKCNIKHEELNTKVGLNSYNNELSTYQNVLKDFKEKHLDSAIFIEKLCNNSDFTQALTIVQMLKEESIQIGAFNLHESIKTMEQEMELGENSQWEKSIWAYGITLTKLSREIDHYLSEIAP